MIKKPFPKILFFLFFLILGIKYYNYSYFFIFLISLISTACLKLFFKQNKKTILASTVFFLLGLFTQKMQISNFNIMEEKICTSKNRDILGQVLNIENINGTYKNKISLKIISCEEYKNKQQKLLIFTKIPTYLKTGDLIKTNLKINKNNNSEFKNYLIREGIISCIFLNKIFYKKLNQNKNNKSQKNKLFKNNESEIMYNSIFIGEKDKTNFLYQRINNKFNFWGTGHILARSGLHLVILIILINFILKLFFLPIYIRKLILTIITFIFFLKTTIALPFARAFWMYILKELNFILNNKTSIINIFGVTTIYTLIANPILLNFLDFQLSFGITFVLILWTHLKKSQSKTNP